MERDDVDVVQLKVRLREHLRSKVEASAKESGRSLSAEIVERLERTFEEDRRAVAQSYGEILLTQKIALCWRLLGERVSERWSHFESGKAIMHHAMKELIDFSFPAKRLEEMDERDRTEFEQLLPFADEVVDAATWRKRDPLLTNRLMQIASGPISSTEAHNKWLRLRAPDPE